ERIRQATVNPMCEVFPKVASCDFHRYGMGGGKDNRFGICVLGLNMINDKVLSSYGSGTSSSSSSASSAFSAEPHKSPPPSQNVGLLRKQNRHMRHIQHYVLNCSIGDWFVLYQMSKNLNKRFFAEFLALIAIVVNPDPNIAPEEPEIFFSDEEIYRIKNISLTDTSKESEKESEDKDDEEGSGDDEPKAAANPFLKMDADIEEGGVGCGLTGKQRMLIKNGKGALAPSIRLCGECPGQKAQEE
ncbi:Innexin, partial [Caligus rogercresseyi]